MQTVKRPTYKDFKTKALQNPEIKKEYESFKPLLPCSEITRELIFDKMIKNGLKDSKNNNLIPNEEMKNKLLFNN